MKLFSQAKETLQDVSAASQEVTETSETMRMVVLIVAGVALGFALGACMAALSDVRA